MEPRLQPYDEFCGGEAFTLAHSSLDGDRFGDTEGGDDSRGASTVQSEEEVDTLWGDAGAGIGVSKGPRF